MPELNWRDAIIEVLSDSPGPMHYADIAQEIVSRGLRDNPGATPASTVASIITSDIKKYETDARFEWVEKGRYKLRSDPAFPITDREQRTTTKVDDDTTVETGLINAFGIYWQREYVLWSNPKLLGQQQPKSLAVDFATQQGVYLLHDRREIIYVGRTTEQGFGERIRQHTINRLNGRWDRFSWFGIRPVHEDGTLGSISENAFSEDNLIATMEAILIEAVEPRQNRKRGDGFNATEFLQARDPDIDRNLQRQMLDKMRNELDI